jgi:anaerobic selenocysteine-containing dehydrogenase
MGPPADRPGPTSVHYRACNLCEAICGLEIRLRDGEIQSIRGDRDDPFSRGHICAKAVALQDVHRDPDRLRRPVRRTATGFEEIGWDEALDLAAAGLRQVRTRHGRQALASYAGNPNVHNWGSMLFGPVLYKAYRPGNRYSATSVDQLPHHLAAYFMFGHQMLLPVPDIDRTDFFLILGANPAISNGSLMTAPDIKNRLKAIRERGGQLVVIDPRRTETATLADRHHFIHPGSDALLLAAMLTTIFEEGLARPGRLAGITDGLDQLPALLAPFTAESVAPATGLEAATVRALTRDFCAAGSAVAYGRMGLSVQSFGGLCQWLVNALNIVTGNFDRPGGAMFTRPAVDVVANTGAGGFGRFRSRVRGLPEFGGELPVATMAEDMLAGGEDRIRALLTVAGNPVLSTPDGAALDTALAGLDFMVAIDFYINETTRHAHVILPPTSGLEHDHYDVIFNLLAIRNVARYSPALFEPPDDARHDWQIYLALAARLQDGGLGQRLKAWLTRWQMDRLGPVGVLDKMLAQGPHGATLRFDDLAAATHGTDLGALEPCLPERLRTEDKRIRLAPPTLAADLSRLAARLRRADEPTAERPLTMIGRRQPRTNNSWMHNSPRMVKGRDRCTLMMHPDDAARHGLGDGQRAVVTSRVGSIEAPVVVTDEMMPGVVSLPHGWGHDRPAYGCAWRAPMRVSASTT